MSEMEPTDDVYGLRGQYLTRNDQAILDLSTLSAEQFLEAHLVQLFPDVLLVAVRTRVGDRETRENGYAIRLPYRPGRIKQIIFGQTGISALDEFVVLQADGRGHVISLTTIGVKRRYWGSTYRRDNLNAVRDGMIPAMHNMPTFGPDGFIELALNGQPLLHRYGHQGPARSFSLRVLTTQRIIGATREHVIILGFDDVLHWVRRGDRGLLATIRSAFADDVGPTAARNVRAAVMTEKGVVWQDDRSIYLERQRLGPAPSGGYVLTRAQSGHQLIYRHPQTGTWLTMREDQPVPSTSVDLVIHDRSQDRIVAAGLQRVLPVTLVRYILNAA